MNALTRIALVISPFILLISLLQANSAKKYSSSLDSVPTESTPTLSESAADKLDHAQSGVVREPEKSQSEKEEDKNTNNANLPENVAIRMKTPLNERLFPKSRIISEEQFGPNEEGIVTKIQLLETNFKFSLIRLEQRWKGDQPLPPVAMVANHVMIERKEGMSDTEFRKAVEGAGLTIDKMLPDTDVYVVSFHAKDVHSIDGVLNHLKNNADTIGVAEPDYIRFVN